MISTSAIAYVLPIEDYGIDAKNIFEKINPLLIRDGKKAIIRGLLIYDHKLGPYIKISEEFYDRLQHVLKRSGFQKPYKPKELGMHIPLRKANRIVRSININECSLIDLSISSMEFILTKSIKTKKIYAVIQMNVTNCRDELQFKVGVYKGKSVDA